MLVVYVERGEGTQTKQNTIENTTVPLRICWIPPSLLQGVCRPNPWGSGMLEPPPPPRHPPANPTPTCQSWFCSFLPNSSSNNSLFRSGACSWGWGKCLHHENWPVLQTRDFFSGRPFVKHLIAHTAWWCLKLCSLLFKSSFQRSSTGKGPSGTPAAGVPVGSLLPSGTLQSSGPLDGLPASSTREEEAGWPSLLSLCPSVTILIHRLQRHRQMSLRRG